MHSLLKVQLRELYKRVHPDLFHDIPFARQANEHSFKLLQEYLDSARKGGEVGRTAGVPFKFLFYLHKEQEDDVDGMLKDDSTDEGDLRRVDLVLPPPARLDAGAAEGALPRATQRALGKLLAACGLDAEFAGGADVGAASHLRDFIPAAAELARQRQFSQRGPRHEISALRTALRLGRQVTIGFAPAVLARGSAEQAEQLRKLAAALDRISHVELAGVHVMLGSDYGVDPQGRLWLDAQDNALFWSGYLLAVDVSECHERQEAAARVRRLEASVAALLGLSMVYCMPSLRMRPEFIRFLERMAAAGSQRGPIGGAREFSGVPLCVMSEEESGTAEPSGRIGEDAFTVDMDMGFLSAPVGASADQVYDFIKAHGKEVAEVLDRRKVQHQKAEDLRRAVERRLRLRRLSHDPAVSHDRFCSACMRLLQNADALMQLLDGLEVRISEVNVVAPDGVYIDIAWDFQI
ncbi:g9326 [Coccomyxa elongata]